MTRTMQRRNFISLAAAGTVGIMLAPKLALSAPTLRRGYTIADILQVAWRPAVHDLTTRRGRTWADEELEQAQREGRLRTAQHFANVFEFEGKRYTTECLMVPMVWHRDDEKTNPRESQRISLATSLVTNTIHSHDYYLVERLAESRVIFTFDPFRYDLGKVVAFKGIRQVVAYTALAVVPR